VTPWNAIIWEWLPPSNTADSWTRLLERNPVVGETFYIEGVGRDSNSPGNFGTLRRSNNFEMVEDNHNYAWWYMRVTSGRGRGCKGDSGGPANNDDYLVGKAATGFKDCAIGVQSAAEGLDPWCPGLGDEVYYSSVHDKIDWLEGIMGPCYHGSSNGNPYARCW